jgi:pantoate--beta-alanine ligase
VNIIHTIREVRRWRSRTEGSVGLVPTMGYLHSGHLSLLRQARAENSRTAVSIFVNPAQFGPREDLASYPRDLDRDLESLRAARCDGVFVPSAEEMYRAGYGTWVDPGPVADPLEGARRPGHFRGVATVVLKLLNIVTPTRAYFGEKDAQQLAVIRKTAADLDLGVEIIGCPIVREGDGLAMSSRNTYLGPEDRAAAAVLYHALSAALDAWVAGETRGRELQDVMRRTVAGEPRAALDYAVVADPATFAEVEAAGEGALLLIAARVGPTRLIDNLRLVRP